MVREIDADGNEVYEFSEESSGEEGILRQRYPEEDIEEGEYEEVEDVEGEEEKSPFAVFLVCKDGIHRAYEGEFPQCLDVASQSVREGLSCLPNTHGGVEVYHVLRASVRRSNA